tara:strand:- start:3534 stop:4208 length:675 start_codon:yes stop_codon:yes gene_type:complete
MIVDVVILSYTKDESLYEMTQNCIDSIINSEKDYTFNITVVETDKSGTYSYDRDNVTTIVPEGSFGYNKFLNYGINNSNNEWVLLSNNDTVYSEGWLSEMMEAHSVDGEILSMSPMDDSWFRHKVLDKNIDIRYGYEVSIEMTGWSILVKRKVIETIGGFDENFRFWYQDDDYSNMLQLHSIKHALITKSKVKHLLSQSHELVGKNKYSMTEGQINIFNDKWEK